MYRYMSMVVEVLENIQTVSLLCRMLSPIVCELRVCLNAWVLTPLLTNVGLKSEHNPEAAFYISILNCIQNLWLTMINKTDAFWPGKLLNSVNPYPRFLCGSLSFQSLNLGEG